MEFLYQRILDWVLYVLYKDKLSTQRAPPPLNPPLDIQYYTDLFKECIVGGALPR